LTPFDPHIPQENLPGFRCQRVYSEACGEGINLRREVSLAGRTLCIPCARGSFLTNSKIVNATDCNPKVLLIVGYKKVGKTTLIKKLIPELSSRGYRVGTVKHHHSDCPVAMDSSGTDTWRHRRAGAKSVALVTPTDVALFRDAEEVALLDQIIATLPETDLVLVEGFHLEPKAKIEVRLDQDDQRLCRADNHLLAVVGRTASDEAVPGFAPDSIKPLVDLIEKKILGKLSTGPRNESAVTSQGETYRLRRRVEL